MLKASALDAARFDWSGLAFGHAARRSVALAAVLGAAIGIGHPELAPFPLVGAFVVGFGSIRALGRTRATPMLFASLGVATAAFAGELVGGHPGLAALAIAAGALAFGRVSASGPATAWVALNCLVFFLVLGLPYPAPLSTAALHAGLVLGGGLLQFLILTGFYYLLRLYRPPHPDPWFAAPAAVNQTTHRAFRFLFSGADTTGEGTRFGVRLAVALCLGWIAGNALGFPRTAWVLMTTALVAKPDLGQTLTRGIGRGVGTLLGGLLATSAMTALAPPHLAIGGLVLAGAFGAYLVFYVNYMLCTVFITSYVVFLLGFEGIPGPEVAWERVVATLVGAGLAVAMWFPWTTRQQGRAAGLGEPTAS